ncbi:hypothetical protein D3C74_395560 [compost metagenome]
MCIRLFHRILTNNIFHYLGFIVSEAPTSENIRANNVILVILGCYTWRTHKIIRKEPDIQLAIVVKRCRNGEYTFKGFLHNAFAV